MKQKLLSLADFTVFPICLGTASFGSSAPEADAFRIMDAYVDGGGNFLDTANIYGKWCDSHINLSEITIGKWLHERGNRNGLRIATKGGHPDKRVREGSRMKLSEVQADLEESLRALGTDCIDLYWYHRDDESVPAGEFVQWMEEFRRQGKIRGYGASNWKLDRLESARATAEKLGIPGFCAIQNRWSLASFNLAGETDPTLVDVDAGIYDFALKTNTALISFSSQGRGVYSKWMKLGAQGLPDNLKAQYENELNKTRCEALSKIAENRQVSISSLVLAWQCCKPCIAVPITAASSAGQVADLLEAAALKLTPDEMNALDAGSIC